MRAHSARRSNGIAARTQRIMPIALRLMASNQCFVGERLEAAPPARAGRVDEDVQRAPTFVDLGERALDLVAIGDIGLQRKGFGRAGGEQLLDGLVEQFLAAREHRHACAVLGEAAGRGAAHPLRSTLHDDGRVCESEIHDAPLVVGS